MSSAISPPRGRAILLTACRERLGSATSVRIAAAFVSRAGLDRVQSALRSAAKRGRVLFLTGLYQGVTEPTALALLARMEGANPGRFLARLSRNRKYHRKLYLLGSRGGLYAIVGSSNLTKDGLTSRGEVSVGIGLPLDSSAARRFMSAFDKDWRNSVRVTRPRIAKYRKWRPKKPQAKKGSSAAIAAILGKDKGDSAASAPAVQGRWWRDCITGFVGRATRTLIKQETDWNARTGWSWFCAGPNPYARGDRILMFDHADGLVYVALVEDTTELKTRDGRYFVAFSRPRDFHWKRLRDKVWRRFGIPTKDGTERRLRLRSSASSRVEAVLKRR